MAKPGKNQQPTKKDTTVTNQANQANAPLPSDGTGTAQEQNQTEGQQASQDNIKDPAQSSGGAEDGQNGEQGASGQDNAGAQEGEGGDLNAAQDPTAAATPEPTQEPTPLAAAAPTAAPAVATDVLREKSDFEIYIDSIRADGPPALVNVLNILEEYQAVMGLNTVTSETTINQQQGALWRAIKITLGSAEYFTECFQLMINFVRQHTAEGAFQHHLLFRGFEHTKLNADASSAFQNILTILTVAAETKNPAHVRKNIELTRAMSSSTFSDEARSRVIGFFN